MIQIRRPIVIVLNPVSYRVLLDKDDAKSTQIFFLSSVIYP